MSINADYHELKSLNHELSLLALKRKKLVEQKRATEERIKQYLEVKNLKGVKYQQDEIVLDSREARARKPPADLNSDLIEILDRAGVESPKSILQKLNEARKGETVTKNVLKFKKVKVTRKKRDE
jgi:hypothetical protein